MSLYFVQSNKYHKQASSIKFTWKSNVYFLLYLFSTWYNMKIKYRATTCAIVPIRNLESQEHPSRSVLKKRCSENMQQTCRRTPMPKCIEIALRHGCSPVNLLHIFRTSFSKNISGRLLLESFPHVWQKKELFTYEKYF